MAKRTKTATTRKKTPAEMEALALDLIKKDRDIVYMEDLYAAMPVSKTQLTSPEFGYEIHKLDTIKEALTTNRVTRKKEMRKTWKTSSAAPLQISLYKLLANEDELRRLGQTIDHQTKGEKITAEPVDYQKLSDDLLRAIAAASKPEEGAD